MMTAIANGELEVANLAYSTFPLAVQNANLDDLRVIADEFQDGVAGYHSNEFSVLKDSPIKKVEDLKGKVIATNATGSAVDIAVARHAEEARPGGQARLHHRRGAVPDHEGDAEGQEGRSDRPTVLPFNFDPELKQVSRAAVLQQGRDRRLAVHHLGGAQVLHRQEPRRDGRLHGGHADHRALVHGPEEPQGGHRDRGKVTKAPPERFGWLFTKQDYYRNPDMLPDLEALQSNINLTHRARLHQGAARCQEIHRSQPRPGGGQAPEVSVTPYRRSWVRNKPRRRHRRRGLSLRVTRPGSIPCPGCSFFSRCRPTSPSSTAPASAATFPEICDRRGGDARTRRAAALAEGRHAAHLRADDEEPEARPRRRRTT